MLPTPNEGMTMGSTQQLLARFEGALEDRSAIVTGAGSGIGRAVSIAFAAAGADVALVGRRQDALEATANVVSAGGGKAIVLPTDVRDEAAVRTTVGSAHQALGALDIVVANAGANAWGSVEEQTPELVRHALEVNVEGVANLIRATVPSMREAGYGKVLVVASDNGRRPEAGGSAYVASKFAAVGLSLSLAQELSETGIAVHVIEPGAVDTDWYPPDEDAPRDRMLSSEDVAYVALLLVTLPPHIVIDEVLMLPRGLLVSPW
jgi:3-oxoacyl-[acyl-carrier protein] reductase